MISCSSSLQLTEQSLNAMCQGYTITIVQLIGDMFVDRLKWMNLQQAKMIMAGVSWAYFCCSPNSILKCLIVQTCSKCSPFQNPNYHLIFSPLLPSADGGCHICFLFLHQTRGHVCTGTLTRCICVNPVTSQPSADGTVLHWNNIKDFV